MAMDYLTLPTGHRMPILGLGTWTGFDDQGPDEALVKQSVETALDSDYKLIDTAYFYGTEHMIGDVISQRIAEGIMKREDVFITSKLGVTFMASRERVQQCVNISLKRLQTNYLDLFLIHGPVAFKYYNPDVAATRAPDGKIEYDYPDIVATWKYMEELVDEGKVRAIGVSNFSKEQIERISKEARHPISNQQVELHAHFQQSDMVDFCKKMNITVTSYSSLGAPAAYIHGGKKSNGPLQESFVLSLAAKYKKSPAQVLLRNLVQRGIAVVPKSFTPSRIEENSKVFDFTLTEEEMKSMAGLDKGQRMFTWEEHKGHPECPF